MGCVQSNNIDEEERTRAVDKRLFALSIQEWTVNDVYDWLTISWAVVDFGDLARKLKDAQIDGKGLMELDEEKLEQYVPKEKEYLVQRLLKTRKCKLNLIEMCQNDREGMERFDRILEEKAKDRSQQVVYYKW